MVEFGVKSGIIPPKKRNNWHVESRKRKMLSSAAG